MNENITETIESANSEISETSESVAENASEKKSSKSKKAKSKIKSKKAKSKKTSEVVEAQAQASSDSEHATEHHSRHSDVAAFERVMFYMLRKYEASKKKDVLISEIKRDLRQQVETYRLSVYFWEMKLKANCAISKTKEKRALVSVAFVRIDDARSYLKHRFVKEVYDSMLASKSKKAKTSEVVETEQAEVTA